MIISALIGSAVWVSCYLNSQNQIDPEASEASGVYTGLSRFAAGRSAEMFVGSTELMDDYAFGWMFNWGSEKTTYLAAQGLQYKFPDLVEFMAVFGGWGPTSTSCDSSKRL